MEPNGNTQKNDQMMEFLCKNSMYYNEYINNVSKLNDTKEYHHLMPISLEEKTFSAPGISSSSSSKNTNETKTYRIETPHSLKLNRKNDESALYVMELF